MAGLGKSTPNKNKQQIPRNGSQLLEAAVKSHKAGNIENAESLYLDAINCGFCHEIAFSNLGVIYKNTNRQFFKRFYQRRLCPPPNALIPRTNTNQPTPNTIAKTIIQIDQFLDRFTTYQNANALTHLITTLQHTNGSSQLDTAHYLRLHVSKTALFQHFTLI